MLTLTDPVHLEVPARTPVQPAAPLDPRPDADKPDDGGSRLDVTTVGDTSNQLAAMTSPGAASVWQFFRTGMGKTLRVEEDNEGALRVDILKEGVWTQAPRGMIGLRLSSGSRNLTAAEILALPLARVRLRDLQTGLSG
jgi:hypothetical protein